MPTTFYPYPNTMNLTNLRAGSEALSTDQVNSRLGFPSKLPFTRLPSSYEAIQPDNELVDALHLRPDRCSFFCLTL